MLLLPITTPPQDAATLAQAIQQSLQKILTLPASSTPAATFEGTWPRAERFTIDISGASFDTASRPEDPTADGPRHEAFTAAQFALKGEGLQGLGGTLDTTLDAKEVQFDYFTHPTGQLVLQVSSAEHGHVRVHATRASLETLLRNGLNEALRTQGVTVEEVQLQMLAENSTTLALDCAITASKKVGFFSPSGTVSVRGKAKVDEQMNLHLSGLAAEGKGGLGSMAAPMLTPFLQKYEGHQVPLLAFSLGGIKLRGVQVSGGDALELRAEFGVA